MFFNTVDFLKALHEEWMLFAYFTLGWKFPSFRKNLLVAVVILCIVLHVKSVPFYCCVFCIRLEGFCLLFEDMLNTWPTSMDALGKSYIWSFDLITSHSNIIRISAYPCFNLILGGLHLSI